MTADLNLLAADPDLAPLWQTLHDRLSAGNAAADIATVTVPALTPGAVAALRAWLDTTAQRRSGRTSVPQNSTGAVKVPLRRLLEVLSLPVEELQPLVERAVGRDVVNRRNHRLQSAVIRQELWDYAETRLPLFPQLRARMKSTGLENDAVDEMRRLIDALAGLTGTLPYAPPRALAKLAHDHAGDPHYFDLGTLPGQRLISAIAEHANQPEPSRPDHIRALLMDHGIIADRLSATVLLHNVKATGDGPIDRHLREANAPVALTLLDLTVSPPTLPPTPLTIVENPSLLEEALTRSSTQPMACTSGQLRAVDHTLFQLAADQGVPLRYAGDLDTAGLQIAATVHQTYGAELVAMDAALVRQAGQSPSAIPIGVLPSAQADTELGQALLAGGRIVYQEHEAVHDRLLPRPPALRHPAPSRTGL
ncbi:DUF2399 domain-containing protein [Streptomyces sp. NPDC059818]|uniref:DUF2399 domain-containing protein n=1 Tax=Streptomyces sp. NPDC059818 TaxID=3346962 RepID=UPI0036502675